MNGWRALSIVLVIAAGWLFLPEAGVAQFGPDQRYLGAHIGLSGVGSAAALGVSGESAYNENIGIGARFDTWSYGQNFSGLGGGEWSVRYVALAGTGAWHFPVESNPKLDPFVGMSLGYFVVNSSWEGSGSSVNYSGDGSRVFVDGFAGLRYHFQENLSGVVRAGATASYLTVGIDFQM